MKTRPARHGFDAGRNNAACPIEMKKRIVRTIVEEVVVDEPSKGKLKFIVHWKGGTHTSFELARQSAGAAQKTADEDLEIIRKMAARYGDDDIAGAQQAGPADGEGNGVEPGRGEDRAAALRHRGPCANGGGPEVLTFNGAAR